MTVATIAEELDINRGAARFIMVEPKNITNDQMQRRREVCADFCEESRKVTGA
jgi:hypothetical protein